MVGFHFGLVSVLMSSWGHEYECICWLPVMYEAVVTFGGSHVQVGSLQLGSFHTAATRLP